MPWDQVKLDPVMLQRGDAVVGLWANGGAAFLESCAAIGWRDCDGVGSRLWCRALALGIYVCGYIYVSTWMYLGYVIHMHVHMCVWVCIHVHTYAYVYMCVEIYTVRCRLICILPWSPRWCVRYRVILDRVIAALTVSNPTQLCIGE